MSLKAKSELHAMSVAKDSRVESRGDRINFIIDDNIPAESHARLRAYGSDALGICN